MYLALTHLLQQGLAEFPLLLDNNKHFPVSGCSQVQVQLFRAGGHFAGELLMGEYTVASEVSVMLNTRSPKGQLMDIKRGTESKREKDINFPHKSQTYI